MRLPRIFGKKRGDRRTGSRAWGSFGDGLFHAVLLAAGLVFAALLVSGVAVPEWRINRDYIATTCRIVGQGLVRRTVEDPPGSTTVTWRPCLLVTYDAAGTPRESWSRSDPATATADRAAAAAALEGWPLGTDVPGWFDPADPGTIVLQRGFHWWMWGLTLLLPGALVAFGGSGLLRALRRWGRSEEAIAAAAGLPALTAAHAAPAPGHPGVPACDDMTNSPGTVLRWRLPLESPESWTLVGLGLFAGAWNAVLAVLAIGAGLDFAGGRRHWFLLGLLVPVVAVGAAAVAGFVRALILRTAVGTTQLEIADHPLRPGGRYDVLLAQGGSGDLHELSMTLECEEQATFRQGTDTRTETLVVHREPLRTWGDVHVAPGTRFEALGAVAIPADAMHSFASEHNAVRWRIVVRGVPVRWPPFTRMFPVVVFPPESAP
ncbi:MAG: DUF3592 domain-containing protein [Planctomycetaceae bacterium]